MNFNMENTLESRKRICISLWYRQAFIYLLPTSLLKFISEKLGQCNGFPSFRHNTRVYSNRSRSRFRSSTSTHTQRERERERESSIRKPIDIISDDARARNKRVGRLCYDNWNLCSMKNRFHYSRENASSHNDQFLTRSRDTLDTVSCISGNNIF